MLHFLYSFLFALLLLQVALSDLRTMTIPDRLNLAILVLGLWRRLPAVCLADAPFLETGLSVCGGLLAAALPMYLLAVAYPGSIGGGDIKLAAASGVFLGAPGVLCGTAAGMTAAGAYALGSLLLHRKKPRQAIPLGPFLAAGYVCQMIWSS